MTGTVAIYSPHDDIRLLLRSLLRLHHYQVVGEGATPSELRTVPPVAGVTVVLDADLEEVAWSDAVQALRAARPELHFVLVTPGRSTRIDDRARELGMTAVLRRPFAMRQLVETMRTASGTAEGEAAAAAG